MHSVIGGHRSCSPKSLATVYLFHRQWCAFKPVRKNSAVGENEKPSYPAFFTTCAGILWNSCSERKLRRFKQPWAAISAVRCDRFGEYCGQIRGFVENGILREIRGISMLLISSRRRVRSYLFYWIAISSPFPTHTYGNGLPTLITQSKFIGSTRC